MISYVTIGVKDLDKAKEFYVSLFSEMGAKIIFETERSAFFGKSQNEPMLAICIPFNKEPANCGNGNMTAISPGSTDLVKQMYGKAIELGATCEGKPGERAKDIFYGAYIRDLDGNKLAFAHWGS